MPMPKETLENYLKDGFPEALIQIRALVADNDHYQVVVVCDSFKKQRLIQRHQRVYKALKEHMGTTLHAMQLKTLTTQEAHQLKKG
jgi:stress-induced morphogen